MVSTVKKRPDTKNIRRSIELTTVSMSFIRVMTMERVIVTATMSSSSAAITTGSQTHARPGGCQEKAAPPGCWETKVEKTRIRKKTQRNFHEFTRIETMGKMYFGRANWLST